HYSSVLLVLAPLPTRGRSLLPDLIPSQRQPSLLPFPFSFLRLERTSRIELDLQSPAGQIRRHLSTKNQSPPPGTPRYSQLPPPPYLSSAMAPSSPGLKIAVPPLPPVAELDLAINGHLPLPLWPPTTMRAESWWAAGNLLRALQQSRALSKSADAACYELVALGQA
ncbi:unnamed protein product, partial [Urochloa humidicola]